MADIRRGGNSPSGPSLAAARSAGVDIDKSTSTGTTANIKVPNLIANLFGYGSKDADKKAETDSTGKKKAKPAKTPAKTQVAGLTTRGAKTSGAAIPLPANRPAAAYQVAAATTRPVSIAPSPKPTKPVVTAALSANDVIKARGFWRGLPEAPEISASRKTGVQDRGRRSTDPVITAGISPWSIGKSNSRNRRRNVPTYALAYSAAPDVRRPRRAPLPMGRAAAPQLHKLPPVPANTTVATKRTAKHPTKVLSPPGIIKARPGDHYDNPWLRALLVTPSVRTHMSSTRLGAPDFRNLAAHFGKPSQAVMMTFSHDPHLGMVSERFHGGAVVFVATVTFRTQTALLMR